MSVPDRCYLVCCNLCNKPFNDYIEHIFCRCGKLNDKRNGLWDDILNIFGVEMEVDLFQRDDDESICIMLGMTWNTIIPEQRDLFVCTVAKWINVMIINPHQVFINTI